MNRLASTVIELFKFYSGIGFRMLVLLMFGVEGNVCATNLQAGLPVDSSLIIWQNKPVDPALVAVRDEGICTKPGNRKIQWDVWGLPIGNGRLGAVFYGNVEKELIQFNESSLWTGSDIQKIGKRENDKRPTNMSYGSYQPFGDIHITFPDTGYTNYRRELDVSRAVGKITYKSGGVNYCREYFASYPDQVIVVHLSADRPGSINCKVALTDRHFAKITSNNNSITASGKLDKNLYITNGFYDVAWGNADQIANAKFVFAGNDMKYEAQLRVIIDGGRLSEGADENLKVDHANSVIILLAAGTDYLEDAVRNWSGKDPHAKVTAQINAASKKTFQTLLSRHEQDYQSLFNRLQLDLGQSDRRKKALPMRERLEDYRKDPQDPELVTLMAQFGRYLLISSSRPGGLPANLQGLWNPDRIYAPWSADYHMNVNLEMNYWQTGPGNISECDVPLLYWMQSVMPVLKRETRETFGTVGWTAGWGVNLFGAGSVAKKAEEAWMCMNLYDYYRFTHDRKMLKNVIYPMIRDAVSFWEVNLVEKNGVLLAPDVQSPEWGPTEDGVLYAQELIWELFTEYIESADILDADKAHRDKIAVMRDRLAAPKIGSKGQLMEWQDEHPELWGKQHRHISHLVGLFPGRQISPLITPELAKAAEVTLQNRGEGGTGWSEIFRAGAWTRLLKGDEAMREVETFIKTHIWPNGLSCINDGDKFQIDANLGLPDIVCEMLLQSQTDVLQLLPALPANFSTGSVRGIRGRGGFLVDIDWDKRVLTRAVIHSTFGGPVCKVRYGDKTANFPIKPGSKVVLDRDLNIY